MRTSAVNILTRIKNKKIIRIILEYSSCPKLLRAKKIKLLTDHQSDTYGLRWRRDQMRNFDVTFS